MSEHSALPWAINSEQNPFSATARPFEVLDAYGSRIVDCCAPGSDDTDIANAALIVHAVNSLARLTTERDAARAQVDDMLESWNLLAAERDAAREALEECKERFANIATGRCPNAPPGVANEPAAFREWASEYADIGYANVSIALSSKPTLSSDQSPTVEIVEPGAP